MLAVKLICVGKMRERFYSEAFAEYQKRLQSLCRLQLLEIAEQRLGDAPSPREIEAALEKEGSEILRAIPARPVDAGSPVAALLLSISPAPPPLVEPPRSGVRSLNRLGHGRLPPHAVSSCSAPRT